MPRERIERSRPALGEGPQPEITRFAEQVDLAEAVVTGDFSACDLVEPVFSQCRLEHALFIGGILRYARFIDCIIVDSDLSGAVMEECSMSRVEFRNCRASGLQAPLSRLDDVGLFSSKLDGANFRMSTWERAEMTESDLADSDFLRSQDAGKSDLEL